jgi:hypothetical protein
MKFRFRAAILSATMAMTVATGIVATASPADARWKRYHDRRIDVDAGDVIAGIALIGVIAAIADSADGGKKRERQRDRDRDYDRDYDQQTGSDYDRRDTRSADPRDNAADACILAVENRAGATSRVDRIDSVERDGSGWRVDGIVRRASANAYAVRDDFTCRYDGRSVTNVSVAGA